MANRIVLNTVSYHGKGAIGNIVPELTARGFQKAFVCSDPDLIRFNVTKKVTDLLDAAGFAYEVYSDIKPNPTIENVQTGVAAFRKSGADCIVAIGGGSSMDTAKAIGVIIEGYTTKAAWEMTDMFHLKAIELIARHLRGAVENTAEGREGMALAQYVAGMGFSNVGLGIVHSMAHGLGALYDTPHGVANAIILPVVMEYNAPYTGEKYQEIARAMGVEGVDAMTQEEYRKAACDAVRKLGQDVGIPADLKAIVKDEDVQFLAESAFADACRPGNPRDTSVEEIAALYRSMM